MSTFIFTKLHSHNLLQTVLKLTVIVLMSLPDALPEVATSEYSANGIGHIDKVKLLQALLVLGLVITLGGCIIPIFIQVTQAHSAWPSLRGYRSNEYWWWFQSLQGKKWRVLRSYRPCNQNCWQNGLNRLSVRHGLYASLIGFNPRRFKAPWRGWAPSLPTSTSMRKSFSMSMMTLQSAAVT